MPTKWPSISLGHAPGTPKKKRFLLPNVAHCLTPLALSLQPISLVATLMYSRTFSAYGPHAAHGLLVGLMVVGFVAQLFIPKRYRRLEAELALAGRAPAAADMALTKDAAS